MFFYSVQFSMVAQNETSPSGHSSSNVFFTLSGLMPKHRASIWDVKGNGLKITWDEWEDSKKNDNVFTMYIGEWVYFHMLAWQRIFLQVSPHKVNSYLNQGSTIVFVVVL